MGAEDERWMSPAPPSHISLWASWGERLTCFVPLWEIRSRMAAWAGMKDSVSDTFCDFPSPSGYTQLCIPKQDPNPLTSSF